MPSLMRWLRFQQKVENFDSFFPISQPIFCKHYIQTDISQRIYTSNEKWNNILLNNEVNLEIPFAKLGGIEFQKNIW